MSPNRVHGTTDSVDRDRNSPDTKCCSSGGSKIDIVHQNNTSQLSDHIVQGGDQFGDKIVSYCTWASVDGRNTKEEREQSNVSAK